MPSLMNVDVEEHTQAVLDIMPRIRQNTWWSSNRNLHVLLIKFAHSQSFLVRDRIYALLGMSEDACNPETFYPCYLKSEKEVIEDTATFLLFGEVPDRPVPMPYLRQSDLWLPITRLAGTILIWALEQAKASTAKWGSAIGVEVTATLIARHLNKGRFEATDVLMMVAQRYGEAKRIADILSNGDTELFFHVTVGFPWRLCVTIVGQQLEEEEAALAAIFGDFVLIRCSTRRPPTTCIERGDDSLDLGRRRPLPEN